MTFHCPEDQVARREEFSHRNPGVSITYSYRDHEWNAFWTSGKGSRKITCRELKDLLDTLEKELGGRACGEARLGDHLHAARHLDGHPRR